MVVAHRSLWGLILLQNRHQYRMAVVPNTGFPCDSFLSIYLLIAHLNNNFLNKNILIFDTSFKPKFYKRDRKPLCYSASLALSYTKVDLMKKKHRNKCRDFTWFFGVEILWKPTVSAEFRGNCTFPQNFHTRKLGEISVLYTVKVALRGVFRTLSNIYNEAFSLKKSCWLFSTKKYIIK